MLIFIYVKYEMLKIYQPFSLQSGVTLKNYFILYNNLHNIIGNLKWWYSYILYTLYKPSLYCSCANSKTHHKLKHLNETGIHDQYF